MTGKPHKRRVAVTCSACQKNFQATSANLLQAAAQALTACRDAGINLQVKHGALVCDEGLILPLSDGGFVARTRIYTEFSRPGDEDD
jgi:hypothetical protein